MSAPTNERSLASSVDVAARADFVRALEAGAARFAGTNTPVGLAMSEVRLPGHRPFRYFTGNRRGLWARLTKPSPIVGGIYEPATTYVLSAVAGFEKPALAFDLGATGGYFAMVMASRVDACTDVIGIDVAPVVTRSFEANRRENPALADRRIEGQHVALSDADSGDITVWMHKTRLFEREPRPEEYRESRLRRIKHVIAGERWKLGLRALTLPVRSLDSICDELGRDPDLVKIDVDGYEAKVLPGAMRLLARRRPWIVLELHRQTYLDRFGVTRADILRPLFRIGYRATMVLGRGSLAEVAWREVNPADPGSLETGDTDLVILF